MATILYWRCKHTSNQGRTKEKNAGILVLVAGGDAYIKVLGESIWQTVVSNVQLGQPHISADD